MKRLFVALFHLFAFSSLQAQELKEPDFATQKNKVIKVDFFSPLTGNTTFKYEQYIKNWVSLEGTVGIIGLGRNAFETTGGIVGFGIKFKKKPDYYTQGMKGYNLMQGSYLQLEGLVSIYSGYAYEHPGGARSSTNLGGAVLLVAGKQWVLADIITVDPSIGIGYGFDNTGGGYHYGFAIIGSEFPIAARTALTIGVLLK